MIFASYLDMISYTHSICTHSLDGIIVSIETDISKSGLPGFCIVGLADTSVKESKERIFTALKNNNFGPVRRKIVINMAPADIRKEGSQYDLPIALGIIDSGIKRFERNLQEYVIIGELSLNGRLKGVPGVLPALLAAKKHGFSKAIIPEENKFEASLIRGIEIIASDSLISTARHLWKLKDIKVLDPLDFSDFNHNGQNDEFPLDIIDIKGQVNAKRAIMIACSGRHNILFYGPPGTGKSMISKRIPYLLPPMTYSEYISTLSVYSLYDQINNTTLKTLLKRPFRSPHHTISTVGLIGGGSSPKPGEISLAHNGVLFLDELPEFSKKMLDSLRQPMEDRYVNISRARYSIHMPSDFMLIASMNPCPCGYFGSNVKDCICSIANIRRYRSKLSGPLLDRIDLFVEMSDVSEEELMKSNKIDSRSVRDRIESAYLIQKDRYKNDCFVFNSQISDDKISHYCQLKRDSGIFFRQVIKHLNLSARSVIKLLKVCRTIADIENSEDINSSHIAEGSSYFRFFESV